MNYDMLFWALFLILAACNVMQMLMNRSRTRRDRAVVNKLRGAAALLRSPSSATNTVQHSLNRSMAMGYENAAEHVERHIIHGDPLTSELQPPIDQPIEQAPHDAPRYPWRS
jgi:hypothetical protein